MKCGFYEFDITPALGSIIPGAFHARRSEEILDLLYVRAMVVQQEEKALAIAVVDACGITLDISEAIRARVSSRIPIAPEDIMVMATHAHGAGPTLTWGEEVVRDEVYIANLVNKAADAICEAWRRAEESEIYVGGQDLTDVSFIRVYRLTGDRLKTNARNLDEIVGPCGTIDPEVNVLGVKQNGKFVGAMVHFTTHPATVATTQTTGDYISALSQKMKEYYGESFVTVFVNGACGNINHIDAYNREETKPKGRYRYVGYRIAETAKSVMEGATTPMTDTTLSSLYESVDVKLRKPTEEQLIAAKRLFDSMGDDLVNCVPKTPNYTDVFFALQAFWIMSDKRTKREIPLQVFRIGDCYVLGTPTQLFVEYGKRMKAATDKKCFVSAFANDYCGYVPTPECMREGVYEARLAKTSGLEPAAGDKVTDAVIDMMDRLK